ncbi:MAG: hypothetical protein A3E01_08220 [Gammaproteobacteria bacterium RIFCSPHIGHO2_12_FULL_63_22]|nr:MAG: hypothetical protein A3E01_08220 [Gammaproteobacteria bacterium RIFCSPHIGHO2_12_FULL_63_22]
MTYLALCQDVKRECGITGTLTTVASQTGELERVVNWVKDAWKEIQLQHPDWRWMRSTFSVNTVAADGIYAGTDCTDSRLVDTITRFSRWLPYDENDGFNVKSYLQSAGVGTEGWLVFLPWSDFRGLYRRGTQTNGTPAHYSIDPQNNLVLGPVPNAIFVVSGEYQMSPQVFSADADVPELPSAFDKVIMYEAMKKVAGYDAASEIMVRAMREGTPLMRALEANQLPGIGLGAPLA